MRLAPTIPARPAPRIWPLVMALLVGTVLTLGAILFYFFVLGFYGQGQTAVFTPEQLKLQGGQGETRTDGIIIHQLGGNGQSQLSSRLDRQIAADQVTQLHWRIDGLDPDLQVRFIWVDSLRQLYHTPLQHQGTNQGQQSLADVVAWKGVITGVGVVLQGASASLKQPVIVRELNLHAPTPTPVALFSQLWQQWTEFEGWRGHSINFIAGGDLQSWLALPLVLMLWSVLCILVYWILGYAGGWRPLAWPLVLILLLSWLALDLRWQSDLWQQLGRSFAELAGKSQAEKWQAYDAVVYPFISQARTKLTTTPARLFLVGDNPKTYEHQRAQFHLAPHNVYSYHDKPPLPAQTKPGDFVLLLGKLHGVGLRRDPGQQALRWNNTELPVELVWADREGLLFKVRAE